MKEQRKGEQELRERVRKMSHSVGSTHQSYCACGGATNEECVTLMTGICEQAGAAAAPAAKVVNNNDDDDDSEVTWDNQAQPSVPPTSAKPKATPCCCLCQLDTLPPAAKPTMEQRFMSGVCDWCRQRVPWHIDGRDESMVARGWASIYEPGDSVTALDVIERLIVWAQERRAAGSEKDVVNVTALIQSLRFRLRNWVSVTVTLRTCGAYNQLAKLSPNLDRRVDIEKRIDELNNAWVRVPLQRSMALAGPKESTEPDDDLEVDKNEASLQSAYRIASASFFFSALEIVSLCDQNELIQLCGNNVINITEPCAPRVEALVDLLLPFRSARQVVRYCARHARRVHSFPLCASALAESTAHGGMALGGMASAMALPLHERMQHLLYEGRVMRPLAGAMPLLQELMLMRWYGSAVDTPARNDDEQQRSQGK